MGQRLYRGLKAYLDHDPNREYKLLPPLPPFLLIPSPNFNMGWEIVMLHFNQI